MKCITWVFCRAVCESQSMDQGSAMDLLLLNCEQSLPIILLQFVHSRCTFVRFQNLYVFRNVPACALGRGSCTHTFATRANICRQSLDNPTTLNMHMHAAIQPTCAPARHRTPPCNYWGSFAKLILCRRFMTAGLWEVNWPPIHTYLRSG